LTEVAALVERCRQGDALAWEALVRQYQGRVFAVAIHYLRDPEEARDLSQDVFVKVYQNLSSFEGEGFLAWLLRLTRNSSIDRLRRKKARPPATDVPVEETIDLHDAGPNPEQSWITDSKKRLVHRALDGMSEQNREVILLKDIQGLNLNEIAELLGVPIGTVKSRSNRARIELARRVVALDPTYGTP
jgi:RNA polymerase sigma-70 factor (ECF subfamily)